MKYKSRFLWIVCLLTGVMGACINDEGNYDYLPESSVIPAVISGLEDNYALVLGTTKVFTATVEGVEGVENLRYMWYIYNVLQNKRDTLGYEKKLDFDVNYESGTYCLWFEVRDTVTDVCVDKKMEVKIESFLSNAWMILESTAGHTDVDVIMADGTLKENLLTSMGTSRLRGTPVDIVYSSRHRQEEEATNGTVEIVDKKVFCIASEEDLHVYNAENMELLKNTADCFYETPAVIKPMDCDYYGNDAHLINDGKYYFLSGSSQNIGKFGYAKVGPAGAEDYDLFEKTLVASQSAMVWDKKSRSFFYVYVYDSQMSRFNEQTDGKPNFGSVTGMDVELKCLLFRSQVYNQAIYKYLSMGYGIMQDANAYYIADIAFNGNNYPLEGYYKLPAGCQVAKSDVLGPHQTASSIFYAQNDQLWVHDVNNLQAVSDRERKLFTFSGEKISYIRHIKKKDTFDLLAVLTNSASGWKLYAFPFIGGGNEFDNSVQPEDVLVSQGEGDASYLIRMDAGNAY